MIVIISDHQVTVSYCFIVLVVAITIAIRAMMAAIRTAQNTRTIEDDFWPMCLRDIGHVDYMVAMFIGTLELAIYPILISTGTWQAIGAWLTIKTAAAWRWQSKNDRQGYTNFLFGNAIVLFFAFLLTPMLKA